MQDPFPTTDSNNIAGLGTFTPTSNANSAADSGAPDLCTTYSTSETKEHNTIKALDTNGSDQSLLSLLPSPQDAVTIVMNTLAWLWGAETPSGSVLRPDDTIHLLDLTAISRGTPIQVAKTLVLFALYMQQLPNGFDETTLGFESVDQAITLIGDRVKAFVMTHEDQASSLDGLECLLLLGTIELNTGNIRKTWATFRRTVDMAKLAGLHDCFSPLKRDSRSNEDALRRRIWLSAVCGDCYYSLLLGQEPAVGASAFGPTQDWTDPVAEHEANIQRHICAIMSRIAERNYAGQFLDRHICSQLGGHLDRLYESLPCTWWDTPSFAPDRSLNSAEEPNRLVCQIWYFLTRIFIDLPSAFGATESFSRDSLNNCIDAARCIISRYVGLQHARDQLSRCRGGDQAVFLSAVVLLLAVAQRRAQDARCLKTSHQRQPAWQFALDRDLVQQTISSFEAKANAGSRGYMSTQCVNFLYSMHNIAFSRDTFAPSTGDVSKHCGTPKTDMESLVMTAIRPSLGNAGPAVRLIESTLANETGPDESRLIATVFSYIEYSDPITETLDGIDDDL